VLGWAFARTTTGRLRFRILLWSEVKKSGKTLLAAFLLLWWCFVTPHSEAVILANDLEQSTSRVFKTATDLIQANPALGRHVKIKAHTLVFANGTIATAVAAVYKGAAGGRHSLAIFDELWGYELERATRLFEELTPIPGDDDSWILVTTTAGFFCASCTGTSGSRRRMPTRISCIAASPRCRRRGSPSKNFRRPSATPSAWAKPCSSCSGPGISSCIPIRRCASRP
jgi:hypothetical protein